MTAKTKAILSRIWLVLFLASMAGTMLLLWEAATLDSLDAWKLRSAGIVCFSVFVPVAMAGDLAEFLRKKYLRWILGARTVVVVIVLAAGATFGVRLGDILSPLVLLALATLGGMLGAYLIAVARFVAAILWWNLRFSLKT